MGVLALLLCGVAASAIAVDFAPGQADDQGADQPSLGDAPDDQPTPPVEDAETMVEQFGFFANSVDGGDSGSQSLDQVHGKVGAGSATGVGQHLDSSQGLHGTEADDNLGYVLGSDDVSIYGHGGDDHLNLGENAQGHGGDGDDYLYVQDENSIGFGEAGDDTLIGQGATELYGGEGNDLIEVRHGYTDAGQVAVINGGEGDDTLIADNATRVAGGAGDDTLILDSNFMVLNGPETDLPIVAAGGEGADHFIVGNSFACQNLDLEGDLPPMAVITDFNTEEDQLSLSVDLNNSLVSDVTLKATADGSGTDVVVSFEDPDLPDMIVRLENVTDLDESAIHLIDREQAAGGPLLVAEYGTDQADIVSTDSNLYFLDNGGDDVLTVSGEAGLAHLGDGDDSYTALSGVHEVQGGSGDDSFAHHADASAPTENGLGASLYHGGEGDDTMIATGDDMVFFGDQGADTFIADRTSGSNVVAHAGFSGGDSSSTDVATISLGQSALQFDEITVNAYPEHLDRGPAVIEACDPAEVDIRLNLPSEVSGELVMELSAASNGSGMLQDVQAIVKSADGTELISVTFAHALWEGEDIPEDFYTLEDILVTRDAIFHVAA